jgi:CRISPR/Cas system-associated exonuclease Cas4 (RecB family)
MAALGLLGTEPLPITERQHGRFQRGKDAQRYIGQRFEEKYGADDIEHERAVAWPSGNGQLPIGELHEDIYVRSEKLIVEVKSSENIDGIFDSALLQVKGQLHFDPEAESAALAFIDRDYQITDMFPVVLTDEDREEIDGIAANVVHAGKTGELPPRVCATPGEGISHMCPFIAQCFEGWEPPADEERPDIEPVVAQAYLAKRDLDEAKSQLKPLEERWDAARAELDAVDLPPKLAVLAGQVLVKRTPVAGRESFSLAKARKLGLFSDEDAARFDAVISVGAGHNRFSLERIGDEPLDLGFGDEAPF